MKVESVYRHLQLGEVSKIDLSVETQWIEEWARLSGLSVVFLHVDARLQNAQNETFFTADGQWACSFQIR